MTPLIAWVVLLSIALFVKLLLRKSPRFRQAWFEHHSVDPYEGYILLLSDIKRLIIKAKTGLWPASNSKAEGMSSVEKPIVKGEKKE
ncbi:MAG: hypothetical protein ABSG78_10555 [Verrucomicrobiota bacterium]|jgi:hypothetical protein